MSTGNGGACIGLANTNKQPPIGAYVQNMSTKPLDPGPEASDNYAGANAVTVYDTNVLGEAIGFTVRGNQGAAIGKLLQWVQAGGAIAAGATVAIAAGVATAGAGTFAVRSAMTTGQYGWAIEA